MGCPQCKTDELSPSGACLICGYQTKDNTLPTKDDSSPAPIQEESSPTEAKPAGEEESQGYSGMIEMDYADSAPEPPEKEKNELPQWRQELSQRLNEIKQKRESAGATAETKSVPAPVVQAKPVESLSVLQARLMEQMPVRKPQPPLVPPPRQKTLEPIPSDTAAPKDALQAAEKRDIRSVIDSAVARQLPKPAAASSVRPPVEYEPDTADQEGKLILLSRTLSGLVDLIIVVLCTGLFVLAADFFSGIIVLDKVSLIDFALLFLLNYFLYSFYFLFASSQTIGMMITDLRVVGSDENRPSIGQLLRRCTGHLISLFGLGIGLLLGLFNRRSLCFHDRASGTHVIRI
jgi:uncharacterized RDD family membrane protein YckC